MMPKRLQRLMAIPSFTDEKEIWICRVLNMVLWASLVSLILFGLIAAFTFHAPGPTLGMALALCMMVFANLWLLRRGYLRQASWLFALFLWLFITFFSVYSGGVYGGAYKSSFLVILVLGVLLDWRAGFGFVLLSIASGWGLVLAEQYRVLPPAVFDSTSPVSAWILASIIFVVTAVWQHISTSNTHNALQQLKARTRELEAVRQIGLNLALTLDLNDLLQSIMDQAAELMGGDVGGLFLYRPDEDVLELVAHYHYLSFTVGTKVSAGQGLVGQVWQNAGPLVIENYAEWENHLPELKTVIGPRSVIALPIQQGDRQVGVITITAKAGRHYSQADVHLLELLIVGAAAAIQNAGYIKELEREISGRKKIEAEREALIADLESKNAELERFTYTVSHDLKSPLVTVRGFLGYLEKDIVAGKQDRIAADLERIHEATEQMRGLLDDLLELSRIGRLINPPQNIPFNEIVHEAIALSMGHILAQRVQLEIEPDMPIVYVDRLRMVEVVQNLVDNALKFMGDQADPVIEIGVVGDNAFFVRDNGIGIEPKYHHQIFGLFNRLDQSGEGTGVGLTLVKRIIEVHNGRIWIESLGMGQGSTFYFTLPVENST